MERIIEEYKRMAGVGPSLMEKTMRNPPSFGMGPSMLDVLAKAFSVKAVKPADVRFIMYRKVGKGVELEDKAAKFGGILTSVESKEADPKALMDFLKKHGAKPAPKVESVEMTEKTKRDWYEDGRGMWRKEGTRFAAYVRDHGRYAEWNVSTVTGAHYSVDGHAANPKAAMKAAEQGAQKLARQIKDERTHMKQVKARPKRSRPERGAPWESVEEAASDLLTELKFDDSKIDPKKHGKPGKPYFVVQSHNTSTIFKPRVFKKGNIKKRAGDYARELAAKTKKLNPSWGWIKIDLVRDVPPKVNPHGISFSQSVRASMYRYIDGVWKHKDGPTKISGLNESLDESDTPAHIILKQMGGSGRLKAMLGAKHFISHDGGKALSFQFPNRKRSKGNYVKITLRPDDTYDMEFSQIVKYEAKPVKSYKGIYADQLKPIFEKQTGLRLSLGF